MRNLCRLKASLLAEVSALLEMVARRHYVNQLRERERDLAQRSLNELKSLDKDDYRFKLPDGENYNRVYQANISRLGALSPSEATLIVRFYQLADSVRADVSREGMLAVGSVNHEAWGETAGILESAIEIGLQLTTPRLSIWKRLKKRMKK